MPAAKARRVGERKAARNRPIRTLARNRVVAAREAIAANPASDEAEQAVTAAKSALAVAARKGIVHKKNAARRTSRLARALNRARASQDA
ncbi:MAG: 30S ribosomal protein S20 [Chloroflexi bacterium]|nr:30S ribosomal protein S20 [Chloroflexota bacterium]